MSSVHSDAAAIDAPCPICGERPIEQSATAVRVTGFLIAYQIKRKTVIGCGTCTRNKCLKAALGTLLTGWWSITSAIINPFAVLYNVLRAPITRSPSSGLVDSLEESGIDVVAGLSTVLTREGIDTAIQIATSVAAADDEIDDREVELIEAIAEDWASTWTRRRSSC